MVRACPEFYDVFEKKKQFDDHDFSLSQDDYPLTKHAAIASHSKRMLIILHVLPVYVMWSSESKINEEVKLMFLKTHPSSSLKDECDLFTSPHA